MIDPIFWLGLSILLVAISLTALLAVAIPAFKELARASRSAEKLFDTLNRELPPTLEAIRLTSMEITELTDDVTEGVQNAGQVTKTVNEGVSNVTGQVKQAGVTTRSVFVGMKTAWKTFRSDQPDQQRDTSHSEAGQLPAAIEPELDLEYTADEAQAAVDYEDTKSPDPSPKARSLQEEDLSR